MKSRKAIAARNPCTNYPATPIYRRGLFSSLHLLFLLHHLSPLPLQTRSHFHTLYLPTYVLCFNLFVVLMKTQVHDHAFSHFYSNWFLKLEDVLHHLMEVDVSKHSHQVMKDDQHLQALVSTVTTHLKEYYTIKWASAREGVLPFFSPTWLTPLESAYSSWLTGWKPSAAFRLLGSLVGKPGTAFAFMTEEQRRKIEVLRMKVRAEEEKVEREMERLQVAIADRKMAELAKLLSRRHGQGVAEGLVEAALRGVMGGLEKVMKAADCVRLKTLKGTLDVLTPLQCVQFLAATLSLYLRLRQWGIDTHMAAPKLNIQD